MTVSFVGETHFTQVNSAAFSLSVPAGVADNDGMVVFIAHSAANTITVPGGWTARLDGSAAAVFPSLSVYTRKALSEPASYIWDLGTGNPGSICCAVWHTDAGGSLDFDVVGAQSAVVSAGNAITAPAITATAAGVLIAFFGSLSGQASETWTPPTGMTERLDWKPDGNASDPGLSVNDLIPSAAGSSGTKTAGYSNAGKAKSGVLVQLKEIVPAAALAATPAAVATLTAGLTTAIPLAAATAAAATLTAGLTTAIPLAASPLAVATLTADLTANPFVWAATPSAVATLTAGLTTAISMASSASATASLSASLSTAITPYASMSASAAMTGTLSDFLPVFPASMFLVFG